MRPNISEETAEELTKRANEASRVDAEKLSFDNQIQVVLSTIEEIDITNSHRESTRWFEK